MAKKAAVNDPMDLPEDEFRASITNIDQAVPPADDPPADDPPTEPDPGDEPAPDDPVDRFTLDDDDPPAEPPATPPADMVEIVHNGQVHKVTREKMIELAQKGFDYDSKVGPHARLVQLVTSDPALRAKINEHVQSTLQQRPAAGPAAPDLKTRPMRDDETEDQWLAEMLRENLGAIKNMVAPPPAAPAPPANPVAQQAQQVATILQSRDPVDFHRIIPRLDAFAREKLTMAEYQKVNASLPNLIKFYDWAKPQLLSTGAPASAGNPPRPAQPSFRARSGGGQPPRDTGQTNAWELPEKDFQRTLARLKG